jgi:Zn-finger nucleic acid-binding protein
VTDREVSFLGCGTCFGLFVADADLERYVVVAATPESAAAFKKLLARAIAGTTGGKGGPRACPRCGVHLARLGFGEAPLVVIDRCPDHGIWLDRTELKKVVRASRAAAHPREVPPPEDEDEAGPLAT